MGQFTDGPPQSTVIYGEIPTTITLANTLGVFESNLRGSGPFTASRRVAVRRAVSPDRPRSGTFDDPVGGSYMLASARDWSKFGQLILQQGAWHDSRIFDAEMIRFMATPQAALGDASRGAHLW